ncbi:Vacuolar protein sorting-associated protein IST1 [Sphaceloma murrayae]|uniref:Vacuolar protein sorting-associated protein IST1 n=1 Tax=Sphaceloma murrayae TaxID=2082308 RepID=A0A2K1QR65_9PEZI|nr:Vacuolar protein sorting-associated protein IST1 [Sphaceloma murrayae]
MAPSSSVVNKLKVQLKLSISRLRMVQQKDTAIAKQQRRAMAQLLEQGKLESARIRVENIIRSDLTTELLEILELYCELLIARIGLLEGKDCDAGLVEAVQSLIYAAPRTEIKELHSVRVLLAEKFGKEFALAASENTDGLVSARVTERLRVEPPKRELVEAYLSTIAEAYGVEYPPGSRKKKEEEEEGQQGGDSDDEPGDGNKVKALETPIEAEELSKATPPRDVGPKSPVSVNPPKPTSENLKPEVKVPGPLELKPGGKMGKANGVGTGKEGKKEGPGGKIPDVDELAKRFAQLKR